MDKIVILVTVVLMFLFLDRVVAPEFSRLITESIEMIKSQNNKCI